MNDTNDTYTEKYFLEETRPQALQMPGDAEGGEGVPGGCAGRME
jgi:hypothetical protein